MYKAISNSRRRAHHNKIVHIDMQVISGRHRINRDRDMVLALCRRPCQHNATRTLPTLFLDVMAWDVLDDAAAGLEDLLDMDDDIVLVG
jgi:hypothetical protein